MNASEPDPSGSGLGRDPAEPAKPRARIYRHSFTIRITHWVNALCLLVLLSSGLQIFNAHPALYWGSASDFDNPFLTIGPRVSDQGEQIGAVAILDQYMFETTGVLGLSREGARAFPGWATLPSPQWLAMGRHWHFFFAWLFVLNGLIYVTYSLVTRHLQRGLLPTGRQIHQIGRTMREHLMLRFPEGEEARHYNVLQKLSYLAVLFVLGPLIVLTGLTMSPQVDAAWPWLLDLFGGRQSARTIHFLAALSLVGFALFHILAVLLSGAWNNLRSMLTGHYIIKETRNE